MDGVRLDSETILQLMNGNTVVFRYRLAERGYGETEFTLRRSKQALARAIGPEVTVTPR